MINMSLKKNGGPYNKKQQEERRKKVNELYFEKKLTAVKIAEILNVNRNTVNDDIKLSFLEITESLPQHSVSLFLNQIQTLERQCVRLEKNLVNENDFSKKISIEKMIFQINHSITKFYEKMTFHYYDVLKKLHPSESVLFAD